MGFTRRNGKGESAIDFAKRCLTARPQASNCLALSESCSREHPRYSGEAAIGIAAAFGSRPTQDRCRIAALSNDRPTMPTSRRITCQAIHASVMSFQLEGGASTFQVITVALIR